MREDHSFRPKPKKRHRSIPCFIKSLHRASLSILLLAAGPAATAFSQNVSDGFTASITGNTASRYEIASLILQADGKILVGGTFTNVNGVACSNLARLNLDGSLDADFATGTDLWVNCLALQQDGKILVGGAFSNIGGQFRPYLARLNTNGTVDTAFNVPIDSGGFSFPEVLGLSVQNDGKILVGGRFKSIGEEGRNYIGRLNADGSLDTTFNPMVDGDVRFFATQGDGQILIGGCFFTVSGVSRRSLARINPNGSYDSTLSDPKLNGCLDLGMLLQRDEKILVAGSFGGYVGGQNVGNFARIFTDGGLDTTFTPPAANPLSATVQPDGKLLLIGYFTNLLGQASYSIRRFNIGESLDGSFETNSIVYNLGAQFARFASIFAMQPDGKILAAGVFTNINGVVRLGIARFYPDGSLDTTLNPAANAEIRSFALQPDGRILAGGSFTVLAGTNRNHVARLKPDGTVDSSFDPGANGVVHSLTVQADGKILVGGAFTMLAGQSRTNLGRLNADGSLDASFHPEPNNTVYSVVVQADGKILIGGDFTELGGQTRNRIGRMNANGSIDTGFNPNASDTVYSLATQSDGRILIGGAFTSIGGQSCNSLGRLNADGNLEVGFNPMPSGNLPLVYSLAVQPNGQILVGGDFTTLGGQTRSFLGRLNPNGSLDSNFDTQANNTIRTMALLTDGKILVGGSFSSLGGQVRDRIGRLNGDGSVDATFDPGADGSVLSIAVQVDGKILVGGQFNILGGQTRASIGRLTSGGTAQQSLVLSPGGATATWTRIGTGPEIEGVTLELSTDGTNYSMLGNAVRISNGWQQSNLVVPGATNFYLRARGRTSGGEHAGSGGLLESVGQFFLSNPAPNVSKLMVLSDGSFQLTLTNSGSVSYSVLASTNMTLSITNWSVLDLASNAGGGLYQFTDSEATNYPCRYYLIRRP